MLPFILEDREAIQEGWRLEGQQMIFTGIELFYQTGDLTECPLSIHCKSHLSLDLFAKSQIPRKLAASGMLLIFNINSADCQFT